MRRQTASNIASSKQKGRIIRLKKVTSTNDYSKSLAEKGAPPRTTVLAETQTQGRGRMGSEWLSPRGGLWMSVILYPPAGLEKMNLLSAFAALAAVRTLRAHGVNAQIKWPNDLMVDGQKIGGILCEASVLDVATQWLIVGFGINVNNPPPRLPAERGKVNSTSVIKLTGKRNKIEEMSSELRNSLLEVYEAFLLKRHSLLLREYNSNLMLRGREVRIDLLSGVVEGVAVGMDPEGRLEVKSDGDGSARKIEVENVLHVTIL